MLAAALLFFFPCLSLAQQSAERMLERIMGVFDSTYVAKEQYNSYANVYVHDSRQRYDFALGDGKQRLVVSPTSEPKVGVKLRYKMLVLSYAQSVNTLFGQRQHRNTNLAVNLVANRWGLQLYHRGVNGDAKIVGSDGLVEATARDAGDFSWDGSILTDARPVTLKGMKYDGFHSRETGVDLFYVFNARRFSYKAAYRFLTRQVRSAGSVIAGLELSDFKGNLVLTHSPFVDLDAYEAWVSGQAESFTYVPCVTQEVDFRYRKVSARIGYGYNWVFARNFLFNVTAYPVATVKWSKFTTYTLTDFHRRQRLYRGDWSLDFNALASLQWNNGKVYAGAYGNLSTFRYEKEELDMSRVHTEFRICVGKYFNLFK